MIGLPGGSSAEGPASTAGCVFVVVIAGLVMAALMGALYFAVSLIGDGM
jgi:hypothetical protein